MAPHQPPALMDDVIIDILLRLPPEDIACLARASLVCKTWRRLLSDRAFFHRYREIHRSPPFLGFLYNNYSIGGSNPFFVQTTPASPFAPRASAGSSPTCCRTLDCRHGRVLLHHPAYPSCLTVWNPVSGLQRRVSVPVTPLAAAVLCASHGGCDHLDCSDGPFLVVFLAKTSNGDLGGVGISLYLYSSSETRKWSVSDSIYLAGSFLGAGATPSLLAKGALFFLLAWSGRVLKYDLTSRLLSVICVPLSPGQDMTLCTAGDGGLGFAAVSGCLRLRLFSGRTDPDGITRWAQDRPIELDSVIPSGVSGASTMCCVVGFAEDTGYIFVRANDSIFSVEVKSGMISKIGSWKFGPIFPLTGFYIPGSSHAQLYHSSFISCQFVM